MAYQKEKAASWAASTDDPQVKKEVHALIQQYDAGNKAPLMDAFYQTLEFGTGGLRGIMGVGTNRMNKFTVGAAAQGLAAYLLKSFPDQKVKVAIAYDSRLNSPEFAKVTAAVMSAHGIQVYLFEGLRPTPELSFAIRHLGCQGGVVITASHNPKEYNGFKAYWNDGAQLLEPHDKNVIEEVNAIPSPSAIRFNANPALIITIGHEIDEIYLNKASSLVVNKELIHMQQEMKIVYSALHGSGITLVPALLKKVGFEQIHLVKEQATPDGNFPTIVSPNPEEKEAMSMGLAQAKALDADLLLATDPDADRVGVGVKNADGEWILLNGNQTATLIIYYLLEAWKQAGRLNGKQFITKTIVTTYLLDKIAAHYGVKCYNTLTGFKYIAGIIREKEGKEEYIAGGEESYGYLVGDFVRDKDAVSSCAVIAEIAAYAKSKGITLYGLLQDIYKQFGYYQEALISLTKPGASGLEQIRTMMQNLMNSPPKELAGEQVLMIRDYLKNQELDLSTGKIKALGFPNSNVIQLITSAGSIISARPSGTEPKIKFYISCNLPVGALNMEKLQSQVLKIEQEVRGW
jgi:phosphoglucomutase